MPDVAILTPDPSDGTYTALWRKVLHRLQQALDAVGVAATPTPWTDHVDDASGLDGSRWCCR